MVHYYVYGEKREFPEAPVFSAYLRREGTAIVSIDMHEGHLSEASDCPCPAPRGRLIVDDVDRFHDEARALGVPVIHVSSSLRSSGIDDVRGLPAAWRITMPEYFGPIPGAPNHCLEGSRWTKLRTRVDPRDEMVANKKRLSAFYPTDLDFLLRQMGIRSIVFTGINTDCCVLNSCFEAANLGYRVIVPRDTTRGTNEELESASLAIISLFLGVVTDTGELLSRWKRP
ncbi:cysteine hydrolase family protein [Burkholderia cenocepacia]|uniref:cysteine hydrolase family protein n=1 Tax=Burkholderia cenocepacia TaxID=95486 RepID=UPI000A02E884|nr:isochorismatase family cysteine hydrolase [Burkholderia cenocepacia]MCW3678777.1 cysteine hydrolase [Burkholderia cenocepacia]MDC6086524.1 cysteine hydrolase [Burkholderia cenocepacia]